MASRSTRLGEATLPGEICVKVCQYSASAKHLFRLALQDTPFSSASTLAGLPNLVSIRTAAVLSGVEGGNLLHRYDCSE